MNAWNIVNEYCRLGFRFHGKVNKFKMLGYSEEATENQLILVSSKSTLEGECEITLKMFYGLWIWVTFPEKWRSLILLFFGFDLGHGTALVQCTLETKPLELKADYAVSLKVEPVQAVYDAVGCWRNDFRNFNLMLPSCVCLKLTLWCNISHRIYFFNLIRFKSVGTW